MTLGGITLPGPAVAPDAHAASAACAPVGGCDGGEAAALGNNADFILNIHAVLPPPATVTAYKLRSLGREVLKKRGIDRRMRWCGSRIVDRLDGVSVYSRPDRAYGRVSGVCVCGQSICCPVCAPRISARRSARVATAYQRALNGGLQVSLESFTMPHRLDESPDALTRSMDLFVKAWRYFQHNADRRNSQFFGAQIAREITWGSNGWHYHHHRCRYDRAWSFDPAGEQAAWLSALEFVGLRTDAAEEHAYHFGAVGSEAGARYVAKMSTSVEAAARAIGCEVASSATKGRNINSLLLDLARGETEAEERWVNGVCCITAAKLSSVKWTPMLAAKFMMAPEKEDRVLAREEVLPTDKLLGALNPWQWQGILRWQAEFSLLMAAQNGRDSVNEFLAGLQLGQLDDEDPRLVWRNDENKGDY